MPERYTRSDWPHVKKILAGWIFNPFRGYRKGIASGAEELLQARIAQILEDGKTRGWFLHSLGSTPGLAILTDLPWDSEQLALQAARLHYLIATGAYNGEFQVKNKLLAAVVMDCLSRGMRHLSVRVDASDLSSIHALENSGFILLDGILTFTLELSAKLTRVSDAPFVLRLATPEDSDRVAEVAQSAFIHDRFHSDPAIPHERADRLHAAWLRNSCAGWAADAVVVAEDEEGMLGFVTCKVDRETRRYLGVLVGTIVLVATSSRSRGRGVARAMTMAALEWFQENGCDVVEVGTQLRNVAASRLYEACGFRISRSSVSLRRLI